jgi:hypothetical protein
VLLMRKHAGIDLAAEKTFEICAAANHSSRSRNLWESEAVRSSP